MQILLVQKVLGFLLMLFSLVMLVPFLASVVLDSSAGINSAFLSAFAVTAIAGFILWLPVCRYYADMRTRDGFLVVVLFWLVLSYFGSLPFYLADELALSWIDSVFESTSGLTTTGATIFHGLDTMPSTLLLYRHLLQWLGGLGIIILAIAIVPMLGVGGMQLYRAETPGPIKSNKMTPRITETAKVLWYIYTALTALCMIAYYAAGMSWFDALCHALSTLSIGGFSTHDANIGHFDSGAIEMVAIVFMLLAGVNFSLHFMAFRRLSTGVYFADSECRAYLAILAIAATLTVAYLYWQGVAESEAVRLGLFQAVSIGTTTGFTTANYAEWPSFLPVFLLSASFIGGCAGSTGGGIKVIRFWLLVKQGLRELKQLIHPNASLSVQLGKNYIDNNVLNAVWGFFSAYVAVFVVMIMLMLASGNDELTAFSSVAATLNNLGPGLGDVSINYAALGDYDKAVLCISMLLGRLEIFTLLVVLTPAFWRL